jgi:hypothetical protein
MGAENSGQHVWRMAMSALIFAVTLTVIAAATLLGSSWEILALKAFLVFALGLFPGWLYLQFIGFKAWTLYDEYVLNLYRLCIDDPRNLPKPPPGSPFYPEWHESLPTGIRLDRNIYLKKFEAAYGVSAIPPSRRRHEDDDSPISQPRLPTQITQERFGPVLLATALFTVGWAAVLQPEVYHGAFLHLFGALRLSGLPQLPVEALRTGYIGSYVFIVQSLVRRYFQQDLKSRAYVGFVARIVFVSAVVVPLHPVWVSFHQGASTELAAAFLLGFYPELGLRLLKQRVMTFVKRFGSDDETHYPLHDLDGCNLWCQARLLEEGVEDMQNLVTANLVDLMVNTRMPVSRMLDWMDQAYLYLRIGSATGTDPAGQRDRTVLRRYGVRTASQLCELVESSGPADFTAGVSRLLNVDANGTDDGLPSRVEAIHRTLDREVNLWHIRAWKRRDWLAEAAPADARDPAGHDVADARLAPTPRTPGPGRERPGPDREPAAAAPRRNGAVPALQERS